MCTPHLLPILLLISLCTGPIAAQSLSNTNPSQLLSTPSRQTSAASIAVERLQLPFHRDIKDLSPTIAGTTDASGQACFIIPPHELYAIPPLESRIIELPTFGQSSVCYSIRTYRVTRDDPESDSTRPDGYSTCQPATRFRVKDADDLGKIVNR